MSTPTEDFGDPDAAQLIFANRPGASKEALPSANGIDLSPTELTKRLESLRDGTPLSGGSEAERESQEGADITRAKLIELGVPPCYPDSMKIPLDPPVEFQAIVNYFQTVMFANNDVLNSQYARYEVHITQQHHSRMNRNFTEYMDEVTKRRRRHGLPTNVLLAEDYRNHSKLQNWIEYENFELCSLEGLEATQLRRMSGKKKSFRSQEGLERYSGIGDPQQHGLDSIAKAIENHWILLNWIKQEREKMAAEDASEPRRLRPRPAKSLTADPKSAPEPSTPKKKKEKVSRKAAATPKKAGPKKTGTPAKSKGRAKKAPTKKAAAKARATGASKTQSKTATSTKRKAATSVATSTAPTTAKRLRSRK